MRGFGVENFRISEILSVQVKAEIEAVLREGHNNKEGELCVQAIFSLLDVLKKFIADLKEKAAREEGMMLNSTWTV